MAKRLKRFESWQDAFDYCREKNHPVILFVKDEKVKLFPNGWINYFDESGEKIREIALSRIKPNRTCLSHQSDKLIEGNV